MPVAFEEPVPVCAANSGVSDVMGMRINQSEALSKCQNGELIISVMLFAVFAPSVPMRARFLILLAAISLAPVIVTWHVVQLVSLLQGPSPTLPTLAAEAYHNNHRLQAHCTASLAHELCKDLDGTVEVGSKSHACQPTKG
ncbi:hypothetical protein BJ741DRAFT_664257 [Chytriomyces cf. hyalinus JEL632]|nr:hypothetical protein BJ741DRAFT_664257 [Chytriomyces cf. hyalinus JEL632]